MTRQFTIACLFLTSTFLFGQNIDSLKAKLPTSGPDQKIDIYMSMARHYLWSLPDSTIKYAENGLALCAETENELRSLEFLFQIATASAEKGNFTLGLELVYRALEISSKFNDKNLTSKINGWIGSIHFYAKNYEQALSFYLKLLENPSHYHENRDLYSAFIGETYYHLGKYDSAYIYLKEAYDIQQKSSFHWSVPYLYMGKLAEEKGNLDEALEYYKASMMSVMRTGVRSGVEGLKDLPDADYIKAHLAIGNIFKKLNNTDSSIYYAKEAYWRSKNTSLAIFSYEACEFLKDVYKTINTDSAFKYQEKMILEKEELFSREKINQLQNVTYQEEKKQLALAHERQEFLNKVRMYALIAGLLVIAFITIVLIRNNRFKQKANDLLHRQKSDLNAQNKEIEAAYNQLKATQSQLIQSEKMASLGELTAGIAHEIQNPLNFVNNFSELNQELIRDLKSEIQKGNIEEVNSIAADIESNEEKINHHGKRADGIVKGMLQHSRSSSGVKEPTDINALADEYLRLAYHGLRAKDKSFNVILNTYYDPTIRNIHIIPQDIGRVVLNLINNAFYAVNERALNQPLTTSNNAYIPTVTVTTKKLSDKIEIKVKDNGNGIPASIKEKIFQPFFTTKPTGQGTGLGLSLSYDIVKAHGGELKMESKEEAGSEFVIKLPTQP